MYKNVPFCMLKRLGLHKKLNVLNVLCKNLAWEKIECKRPKNVHVLSVYEFNLQSVMVKSNIIYFVT